MGTIAFLMKIWLTILIAWAIISLWILYDIGKKIKRQSTPKPKKEHPKTQERKNPSLFLRHFI